MAHTKVITKDGRIELSGSYSYLSSSLHEDSGSLVLGASGSNRMFIKGDGKVGIGNASPSETLSVSGNVILGNGGGGGYLKYNTGNLYIQGTSNIVATFESAGNVGIGTDDPDTKLHIEGGELTVQGSGANSKIHMRDSAGNADGFVYATNNSVGFLYNSDNWAILCSNNDYISFNTDSGTERMKIDGTELTFPTANYKISGSSTSTGSFGAGYFDGKVGIGTTNPSVNLHLKGASQKIYIESDSGHADLKFITSDTDWNIAALPEDNTLRFWNTTAGDLLNLKSNGRVGIGTDVPDGRLHIYNGSAGSVTANTENDDLIIEGSGNTGMTLIGPDANDIGLGWGSATLNRAVLAKWNYAANSFRFRTARASAKFILGGGNSASQLTLDGTNVGIGTESPGTKLQVQGSATVTQVGTEDLFSLIRQDGGTVWSQMVSFALGRHTTGSDPPKSRLDIKLKNTNNNNGVANVTVMTLLDTGNVGIGVTDPDTILDVFSASAKQAQFSGWSSGNAAESSNSGEILIGTDSFGTRIQFAPSTGGDNIRRTYIDNTYDAAAAEMRFRMRTSGTDVDAMTILGSGNVGIGVTDPDSTLEIKQADDTYLKVSTGNDSYHARIKASVSNDTPMLMTGISGNAWMKQRTSSGEIAFLTNGENERVRIDASGNVIIGHTAAVAGVNTLNFQVNATSNSHGVSINNWGTNGANQGFLYFNHSKSGTAGSHTVLANNDAIGAIYWQGSDGTDFANSSARIVANVDGTPASNRVPGEIVFETAEGAADNDILPKMIIRANGNVGIGTTSPSKLLHVAGDAQIDGTLTAQEFHTEFVSASIVFSSGSTKFGDTMDDIHQFTGSLQLSGSVGNESYIIGTNVGIGTSSPLSTLHIDSTAYYSQTTALTYSGLGNVTGALINGYKLDGDGLYKRIVDIVSIGDSANNRGSEIRFLTAPVSDGVAVPNMVIDPSGNVGIGCTPNEKLTVDVGSKRVHIKTVDGNAGISATNDANSADTLRLHGYRVDIGKDPGMLYVKESGNVGIGTQSPSAQLHVTSAPANGVYLSYLYNSGTHASSHGLNVQIATSNAAAYGLRVNTGGDSNALAVMGNGNVGIGTSAPNSVWKTHIWNSDAGTDPSWETTAARNLMLYETANNEGYVTIFGTAAGTNQGFTMASPAGKLRGGTTYASSGGQSLRFWAAGSERMRISGSGNIGIGTTGPDGKLHVHTATAGSITANTNADDLVVENSSGGGISVLVPDDAYSNLYFGGPNASKGGAIQYGGSSVSTAADRDALIFVNNEAEAMRIDSSGKVGIGTTTVPQKLTVAGNISGSGTLNIDGNATFGGDVNVSGTYLKHGDTSTNLYTSVNNLTIAKDNDYRGTLTWGRYGYQIWEMGGENTSSYIKFKTWVSGAYRDNVFFYNNGTTLFNYDATFAGNVDITKASNAVLTIKATAGNTGARLKFKSANNDSTYIQFLDNDDTALARIDTYGSNHNTTAYRKSLVFSTNGNTEALKLDNSQNATFAGTINSGAIDVEGNIEITVNGQTGYSASSAPTANLLIETTGTTNSAYTSLFIGARGSAGQGEGVYLTSVPIGDGNTDLAFTTLSGYSSSEKVRFQNDGNVGIGTTSPGAKLDIYGTAGASTNVLRTSNRDTITTWEGTAGVELASQVSGAVVHGVIIDHRENSVGRDILQLHNSGGQVVTFKSTGNVGIGTTAPGNKLEVKGLIGIQRIASTAVSTIGMEGNFIFNAASGYNINFQHNTTPLVSFMQSGNVGIGTTSPGTLLQIGASTTHVPGWFDHATDEDGLIIAPGVARTTLTIEGTTNATLGLIDTGAGSNEKIFTIYTDGGLTKFQSLEDAAADYVVENMMVFDHSSGNVGIGTTGPGELLHINSDSGDAALRIDRQAASNESAIKFGTNGTENWRMGNADSGHSGIAGTEFFISTAGNVATPEFIIGSDGNVGIGTTSPGGRLDLGAGYMVNEQGRQDHVANTMPAPYYEFDGTNDQIVVSDNANLDFGTGDFTVSAWFYFKGDKYSPLLDKTSGTWASQGWTMYRHTGGLAISFKIGDGSSYDNTNVPIVVDKWTHIAFARVGTTVYRYLNGYLYGTHTAATHASNVDNSENLKIGNGFGDDRWYGGISGIKLYNYRLSDNEVKELYSGASVPFKYKGANQTDVCTNGTFESNITGWSKQAAGVISHSNAQAHTGTYSILLENSFSAGNSLNAMTYDVENNFNHQNKMFRMGFWARSVSGTPSITVEIYGQGPDKQGFTLSTTWTHFTFENEFWYSSSLKRLYFYVTNSDLDIYVDDVTMNYFGAVAEYDGSGATGATWYDKSGNNLDGTVTGASLENKIESIEFTGNISGSSTSTGSFGRVMAAGLSTFNEKVTITSATQNTLLVLNPTDDNWGGIQFKYGGSVKGLSVYSSNNMLYGGESGTGTIIQSSGQTALQIDSSSPYLAIFTGGIRSITGNIESKGANAKISGSSTSTGSFAQAHIADKVGIGTTSPTQPLNVWTTTVGAQAVRGETYATSGTSYGGAFVADGSSSGTNIALYTYAAQGANNYGLIVEGGNVGIGTTSPLDLLHLAGGGKMRVEKSGSPGRYTQYDYASINVEPINDGFYFKLGGSSKMHINQYGNVGIGTTSPSHQLNIINTKNAISGTDIDTSELSVVIGANSDTANRAVGIGFRHSTESDKIGAAIIHEREGSNSYGKLHFATKPSGGGLDIPIRMSIDKDGNVGIGTTNPNDGKLQVQGSSSSDWMGYFYNTNAAGLGVHVESGATGTQEVLRISSGSPNAVRMVVQGNGKVGIGTAAPDNLVHIFKGSAGSQTADANLDLVIEDDSDTGIQLLTPNANYGRIYFGDTSNASQGRIVYGGSAVSTVDERNAMMFVTGGGSERMRIDSSGHVTPGADNAQDLGSLTKQWRNIYTADFHLNNTRREEGNEIDGTKGDWTIQEGEEDLFLINNITGKKYSIVMKEIE